MTPRGGQPQTANRRLRPLVVITGLMLLVLDASGFGPITSVRRTALALGAPIGDALAAITEPIAGAIGGAIDGAVHRAALVEENRRLRHRLAEAEGRLAAQPDIEAELRALSEALDITLVTDLDRVTARVVVDRRTEVDRVVELDKGADDGLASGMPVVTGAGLVGLVHEVTGRRAVVQLITDTRTAVGVQTRFGVGLVVGRPDGDLELRPGPELASAIARGQLGDGERLLTSGLERSMYPAGLPVARLPGTDVQADVGTGQPRAVGSLVVEPEADLDGLGYLTVLLIERPA